jgi:hypothetical protein
MYHNVLQLIQNDTNFRDALPFFGGSTQSIPYSSDTSNMDSVQLLFEPRELLYSNESTSVNT